MAITVLSAEYYENVEIKHTHYHNGHQLLFVTAGTATVYVNNAIQQISAGDLVIFSRLEQHAVADQSPDYRRYILELPPELPAGSREGYRVYSVLFNRPEGFQHVLKTGEKQKAFLGLFDAIYREQQSQAPLRGDMLEALVQQLLILICRQMPETVFAVKEDGFALVHQLQMRFHREYGKNYTLTQLARENNISPSYLSHLFKTATGSSVMGYLQACRLAEAKRCLAQTDMRIGEIVEHCGFGDCSNFCRTFRSATGLSPTAFRTRFRK